MKKVCMVIWEDASMSGHWQDGAEPDKPEHAWVTSVGFLMHKTKKHFVLAQSLTGDQHGNVLTIPAGMVKKWAKL